MSRMMSFAKDHREVITYLIVGIMTTIVSWTACYFAKMFLDPKITLQNNLINTIGWVAGVCFAYPLNRRWVFQSDNPQIAKEFLGFAGSRVSTWILEVLVMMICVNALGIPYWISKICIAAVLVTVANYFFSKLLIFRR